MSKLINVSEEQFDDVVLKSETPVLVDFWAPWCGPCKTIGPLVEKLSEEYSGRLAVVKVNVDENRNIATQLGIKGIPAIFTFKSGEIFEQHVGSPAEGISKLRTLAENVLQ